MEMGADDYITKPFEGIELLNAVEIRLKKSAIVSQTYDQNFRGLNQFLSDIKDAGLPAGCLKNMIPKTTNARRFSTRRIKAEILFTW
jgi:DNA-binding response OmpR family regulator